jgi:hypothetical protein
LSVSIRSGAVSISVPSRSKTTVSMSWAYRVARRHAMRMALFPLGSTP